MTTRIKFLDKLAALRTVADHLGMLGKRELNINSESLHIDAALAGMSLEELKALSALGAEALAREASEESPALGDGS